MSQRRRKAGRVLKGYEEEEEEKEACFGTRTKDGNQSDFGSRAED